MRLIDADRLLTDRMKSKYYHLPNGDTAIPIIDIEHAPTIEPEQRWIPCSERFPKEHILDDGYVEPSAYVLVFGDHGDYAVSRYWGNRITKKEIPFSFPDWMDLNWIMQKPIAWMPLPEPYKEEGEAE